jgi:hypothetical protein
MKTITSAEIAKRNRTALAYAKQIEELDPTLAEAIRTDPAQGCFECVWSQSRQMLVRCLAHGGDEDPQKRPVY